MRKQSDGNQEQSPRDDFVLFLDENLHNCAPLLAALTDAQIKYERHGTHFKPGELDEVWLPKVAENRWIIVTKDKGIRYNELEISAVLQYKAREFLFSSGNSTAAQMAEVMVKALPKMKRLARKVEAPFIASLTLSGEVHLRYDKCGSVYEQKRRVKKGNF